MRYSTQTLVGLMAIVSIVSVQAKDMRHGTRHSYARALNDVNTDDGMVFDTNASASYGVRRQSARVEVPACVRAQACADIPSVHLPYCWRAPVRGTQWLR
jgi:hypothetical protein